LHPPCFPVNPVTTTIPGHRSIKGKTLSPALKSRPRLLMKTDLFCLHQIGSRRPYELFSAIFIACQALHSCTRHPSYGYTSKAKLIKFCSPPLSQLPLSFQDHP
jgi:hypothetical protein